MTKAQSNLFIGNTSSKQLDEISRLDDDEGIEGLPRCEHRHASLDHIQLCAQHLQDTYNTLH